MPTFDDDERSTSASQPIDLYQIVTPTATYLLTSSPTDVTFGGGQVYTAITMSRGALQVARDLTGREFAVYLPITHEIVQRYAASGVPEHEVMITLFRYQQRSGIAIQQWRGPATTLTIEGSNPHVAVLRVPSIADEALKVRLPMIGAQNLCNHRLGDRQCTVNVDALKIFQIIASISSDGLTLTTAATSGLEAYHLFGDVVHNATSQRRMCVRQDGPAVLQLSAPLVGAVVGDDVTVFPGCAHDVDTCFNKFGNVVNYGGHPSLNSTINPWAPNGYGVVSQT